MTDAQHDAVMELYAIGAVGTILLALLPLIPLAPAWWSTRARGTPVPRRLAYLAACGIGIYGSAALFSEITDQLAKAPLLLLLLPERLVAPDRVDGWGQAGQGIADALSLLALVVAAFRVPAWLRPRWQGVLLALMRPGRNDGVAND